MTHFHYDRFDTPDDEQDGKWSVNFQTNPQGDIDKATMSLRFLLLLVLTPIGLLTERSRHQQDVAGQLESKQGISVPDDLPGDLPRSLVASVTEHTTRNLHK